ncbi:MAG TPA: hypothetical protein VF192_13755 [Longimicrobiales bacterium]
MKPAGKRRDAAADVARHGPRAAAINLKRTTGGSVASVSAMDAFAAHDRALLVEQVQQIGPQISRLMETKEEGIIKPLIDYAA